LPQVAILERVLTTKGSNPFPYNANLLEGYTGPICGRLHRQHAGKTEVLVVDYVDEAVPMLSRMAAKRRTGYRALGYDIE